MERGAKSKVNDEITSIGKLKKDINGNIEKGIYFKNIIKNHINNDNIDLAKLKIQQYEEMFLDDIEINNMKIIISIIENDLEEAEKIALDGLNKVPFNFDLLYNLAYIYQVKKEYYKSAEMYIRAGSVAVSSNEQTDIELAISNLKNLDPKLQLTDFLMGNPREFPRRWEDTTYIGEALLPDEEGAYFTQYYEGGYIEGYPVQLWNFYKTEILYGKGCMKGQNTVEINDKSILPISILKPNTSVEVGINGKDYKLDNLFSNRYYYIPIDNKGEINISSNNDIVIGRPLGLKQDSKHDIELVLCLFVDGLSQTIFEKYPMEEIMPNTYNFFNGGTIFENCYSNGEWTLPSVPSILSGKYANKHKIFHPDLPHVIGQNYNILSEYFQEDDYFTFQSCGDWRKSPAYGYVKGFDRTIYQSATMGGLCEDIIFSFLENMRAFNNRDHFAWLSFFELHRVGEGLYPDISIQKNNYIDLLRTNREKNKSVHAKYDKGKSIRYIEEIKRLDYYLKVIYDFIERNYDEDEILVVLCSDHGQSFLDEDAYILRDVRTKVPFMIKGKNIPRAVSKELVENVDIFSTILEYSNIDIVESKIDGRVPKVLGGNGKKYIYSESIYPGSTYKAIIRDYEHELLFETEGKVQQDGRVKLGDFKINLINKLTKIDETKIYAGKVNEYFDIIISNISSLLTI